MPCIFFIEDVVGFDVSMDDFAFGDVLESACQLIGDLHGLLFWKRPFFGDYVVQVAVWTKLQDHDDVVYSEEAIVNSGGEETVFINALRKFLQH